MDAFFFCLSPSFFSIIFLLVFLQLASAEDDSQFTTCSPFKCGSLPNNITYPFWTDDLPRPAYCGYDDERYKLKCIEDQLPLINISSQEFRLVHLSQSRNLMTIQRRLEFGEDSICPKKILMDNVFNYSDTAVNITLTYGYRTSSSTNHTFKCKELGGEYLTLLFENNMEIISSEKVEIPVEKKALHELMVGKNSLYETLVQPFDMRYVAYNSYCQPCIKSGGRCGSNITSPQVFVCYCPDHPHLFTCRQEQGMRASVSNPL